MSKEKSLISQIAGSIVDFVYSLWWKYGNKLGIQAQIKENRIFQKELLCPYHLLFNHFFQFNLCIFFHRFDSYNFIKVGRIKDLKHCFELLLFILQ
jgi:hypothetical protein